MFFMVMHSMFQGLNVMMRIGAEDRTIHPYFNRRMYRILSEWKINVTYVEVKDKEHWWWDSMYVDHYMHSNYRCIVVASYCYAFSTMMFVILFNILFEIILLMFTSG